MIKLAFLSCLSVICDQMHEIKKSWSIERPQELSTLFKNQDYVYATRFCNLILILNGLIVL